MNAWQRIGTTAATGLLAAVLGAGAAAPTGTVETARGRVQQAETLLRTGQVEIAEQALRGWRPDTNAPLTLAQCEAGVLLSEIQMRRSNLTAAAETLNSMTVATDDPMLQVEIAGHQARLLVLKGEEDPALAQVRQIATRAETPAQAARLLRAVADLMLQRGWLERALAQYQMILEAYPETPEQTAALFGKGACLTALQRPAEAAAIYAHAAQAAPAPADRASALWEGAQASVQAGQLPAARAAYLELAGRYSNDTRAAAARLGAAECTERSGDLGAAEKEYARLAQAGGESPEGRRAALLRIQTLTRLGRWEEAQAEIDGLRRRTLDPAYRIALQHQQGSLDYQQGRFAEAAQEFERARSDRGEVGEDSEYMLVWCHYLQGDETGAVAVCRQLLADHPSGGQAVPARFWLAEQLYNHDEVRAAEDLFLQITADPRTAGSADVALYWAGRAAMRQKEYLRAVEHFNQLAKQHPASRMLPEARFAQGDALTELGRFSPAILLFEELIRAYPDHVLVPWARGRIGDCKFALGNQDVSDYRDALATYQALADDKNLPADLRLQAACKSARCLEKLGRAEEALDHYLQVVYDFSRPQGTQTAGAVVWFTRAAFRAAEMREIRGEWRAAALIYQTVMQAGVPAADEARQRAQQIRRKHAL